METLGQSQVKACGLHHHLGAWVLLALQSLNSIVSSALQLIQGRLTELPVGAQNLLSINWKSSLSPPKIETGDHFGDSDDSRMRRGNANNKWQ